MQRRAIQSGLIVANGAFCVPILITLALALIAAGVSLRAQQFRQLTISTGPSPRWVTVADLNHDGNPDIVVANAGSDSTESGSIAILLGDGRGGFHAAPGSPFPAGHLPNDSAVGDLNGDGNLDLVIANHQSPYLRVFLGDGRGGFQLAPGSPIDVHSYPHPHGVVVADFNSDGKLDVATDSWGKNRIEMLSGDGAGRLITPGVFFPTGRRPYERLRTADFNHDGHPDIVTTNIDDGTVSILLGDGRGGMRNAPGSPFSAGAKPWEVAVDDLNDDGNSDFIVIPYQRDISGPNENVVTVLLGDGHGGLHPSSYSPLPLGSCLGPNGVAAGDVSAHKSHDIVVTCAQSRTLRVYQRGTAGNFVATDLSTAGGWGSVTTARLTSSPRWAIITANADAGSITIYFPE